MPITLRKGLKLEQYNLIMFNLFLSSDLGVEKVLPLFDHGFSRILLPCKDLGWVFGR